MQHLKQILKKEMIERENKFIKFAELAIIFLGLFFLIYRAPYGYTFNDEPFILSLGQRLFKGDKLITDEWHVTQTFAPFIYIFYAIFYKINGSVDGIILTLRYVYCVLWFATCFFVYRSLRKEYSFSILIFIFLIIYSPYDFMFISYKTIGLISCALLALLIYTNGFRNEYITSIVFAFLICVLVICCPYTAVAYFLYIIFSIVYGFYCHNKQSAMNSSFFKKSFVLTNILTIAFILIIYVTFFVLKKDLSIEIVIKSIETILNSSEHSFNIISIVKIILKELFFKNVVYSCCLIISLILGLIFRNARESKLWIFCISVIGFIFSIFNFDFTPLSFNYEIIDIAMLGVIALILLDKKPKKIVCSYSLMAFIYMVCETLSSDCGLRELCMASLIQGAASIVYIILLLKELWNRSNKTISKTILVILSLLIFGSQFSIQFIIRFNRQFYDDNFDELTETISVGSCKGIITTKNRMENYEFAYNSLRSALKEANVNDYRNQKFLSLRSNPVVYLDLDMNYASFSSWTLEYSNEQLANILKEYYEINKDKIPTIIYMNSIDQMPDVLKDYKYDELYVGEDILLVRQTD